MGFWGAVQKLFPLTIINTACIANILCLLINAVFQRILRPLINSFSSMYCFHYMPPSSCCEVYVKVLQLLNFKGTITHIIYLFHSLSLSHTLYICQALSLSHTLYIFFRHYSYHTHYIISFKRYSYHTCYVSLPGTIAILHLKYLLGTISITHIIYLFQVL